VIVSNATPLIYHSEARFRMSAELYLEVLELGKKLGEN
jgi:hypothetical protein